VAAHPSAGTTLRELRFGEPQPPTNAQLDLPGAPAGSNGDFRMPLADVPSYTFFIAASQPVVLSGGSLALGGPSQVTNLLTLSDGTLRGAGTLTVNGTLRWIDVNLGEQGSTLQVNIPARATLDLAGTPGNGHVFFGATIDHAGNNPSARSTWTGGAVEAGYGATFNNTGTLLVQNDQPWEHYTNWDNSSANTRPIFSNQAGGILRKIAGTGTTSICGGTFSGNDVIFKHSGGVV
jgi:hypothetical protein